MKSWESDKSWSDLFVPEIVRAIAPTVITAAPFKEDAFHATDLVLRTGDGFRIACRVRDHYTWTRENGRYRDDYTVRLDRPSGRESEHAKFVRGWGHLFFYGISNAANDGSGFCRWTLIDLNEWRLWWGRECYGAARDNLGPPGVIKDNGDDSSRFFAFKVRDLPREAIVAHDGWLNLRDVSQRVVV